MFDMPRATVEFVRNNKGRSQIEVLERALEDERDLYMRCCIKNAIKRLKGGVV